MVKAIIFDFGGVLIEWNPRLLYRSHFPTSQEMEDFLQEIDFHEWNAQQDRGRPFALGVSELADRFPHRAELIRAYHRNWSESIGSPITGSLEVLRSVKALGYSVYGLSNWSMETFPMVHKRYVFFDMLDDFLLSGEVGLVKPEPAIFQVFLQRIQRAAEDCLFIDDSLANIKAAARIGFQCIHFLSPDQLRLEMDRMGIFEGQNDERINDTH